MAACAAGPLWGRRRQCGNANCPRPRRRKTSAVCLTHRLHVPWIPTVRWKRLQTRQHLMSWTCWQISQEIRERMVRCMLRPYLGSYYFSCLSRIYHRRGAACVLHIRWQCQRWCTSFFWPHLSSVSLIADRTPRHHWFRQRHFNFYNIDVVGQPPLLVLEILHGNALLLLLAGTASDWGQKAHPAGRLEVAKQYTHLTRSTSVTLLAKYTTLALTKYNLLNSIFLKPPGTKRSINQLNCFYKNNGSLMLWCSAILGFSAQNWANANTVKLAVSLTTSAPTASSTEPISTRAILRSFLQIQNDQIPCLWHASPSASANTLQLTCSQNVQQLNWMLVKYNRPWGKPEALHRVLQL